MHIHAEVLFLIQAIIIIILPVALWKLKFIKSFAPLVMIQILIGIILGPTIIGHYFPEISSSLFPKASLSNLTGISWLGLSLLGFLTGLHFDIDNIRNKGRAFLGTSLGTLLLPFGLGTLLALNFYHDPFINDATVKWAFVIGIATAIAVTALPVLSSILIELKLIDTKLGKRVLGYAIVNDIALWIALATLTAFASSESSQHPWQSLLITVLIAAVFITIMYTGVRKLLKHLADCGHLTQTPSTTQLAFVVGGILLSGLITESIGIHFLLGTFLFGSVMPKDISHGLYSYFEKFTMVILMPFFFVLTGLKTSLSFSSGEVWLLFIAATLVAISGKIIGASVSERLFFRSSWSESIKVGTLMQTKGLMEVVVLNVLLTAHIINTEVFSGLVLMAVITTLLTKPFLNIIDKSKVRNINHGNLSQ